MSDDIIDDIDALIDDQLDGGEPSTGWDCGDPTFPRCPHCNRHWHGLPITERVAQMYAAGTFYEDYRVADDNSRVICEGSDFIGPMPYDENSFSLWHTGTGQMVSLWSSIPIYSIPSRRYTYVRYVEESSSDTPDSAAVARAQRNLAQIYDTLTELGPFRDEAASHSQADGVA